MNGVAHTIVDLTEVHLREVLTPNRVFPNVNLRSSSFQLFNLFGLLNHKFFHHIPIGRFDLVTGDATGLGKTRQQETITFRDELLPDMLFIHILWRA